MSVQIFSSFIPVVIFVVTAFIVIVLLHFYNLTKKGRKNPLTNKLLRSPGESLRSQIDELSDEINYYLTILISIPFVIFTIYLSQLYFGGIRASVTTTSIYVFASLVFLGFCSYKLWKLLKERSNRRLGLDCELAVGQELNQLMLKGCRVFHDFPVEEFNKKFNIDHIVVSTKGVFAVETKGRAKSDKNPDKEERVFYDGQGLKFPGWTEKEPLEQAKSNADWLSRWLSSAVGESVSVYPIVALPGWYVERREASKTEVYVINPKNPQALFNIIGKCSLSETLIERICHQLEQKCRDVEPTAYRQNENK